MSQRTGQLLIEFLRFEEWSLRIEGYATKTSVYTTASVAGVEGDEYLIC